MKEQQDISVLFGSNAAFVEDIYEQYLHDPTSVDEKWRTYFDSVRQETEETAHGPIVNAFEKLGRTKLSRAGGLAPEAAEKQAAVLRLIHAYRVQGHTVANTDPLGLQKDATNPELDPATHGLSDEDMERSFNTGSLGDGGQLSLREIIAICQDVYAGTIGVEYMHITDSEQKRWVQERIEPKRGDFNFSANMKKQILERLTAAEGIERYLHSKYVGQKRFSLEGGESLIPMIDEMIHRSGAKGGKEIVIGMAHRGRLNVLVNILGKNPKDLFGEFEGVFNIPLAGSGDVKYHLGYSSDIETPGGFVHLALSFNPSHLEIINPVVEGSVRARQNRRGDDTGDEVLPILVHGDSAFCGQGVVLETFQLSQTRSFKTGGTVHIVVNNQIGFTTSKPEDVRSTPYSTDVAKMIEAPIFHVNGDDPEAVMYVTQLAIDFRNKFKKDVVIDLVCYRRHGHNEADEPSATQPVMYSTIKKLPTTRKVYADRLVEEGSVAADEPDNMIAEYRNALDNGRIVARNIVTGIHNEYAVDWTPFHDIDWEKKPETAINLDRVRANAEILTDIPDGFELNPRVKAEYENRRKMTAGATPCNWGFAENLAYATILEDGWKIRLTGQDSGRGTFFHRHAVLHNKNNADIYIPLKNIAKNDRDLLITDSLLSEEAVLGFEYGYSTADPTTLVIWEAQFGDFANGAQVVIDQFITSGEAKWGRLCGLVMLLPHGYEGQGPEHSSARLERYLQLCAEHNIQVCIPSTPAQTFHMLRRQMSRSFRKPLVVMSPKSLLRHKLATSTLEDLTEGYFHEVIDEIDDIKAKDVERVVLCSGKVYYDLLEERRRREQTNVALVRVEQLYPFPTEEVTKLLRKRYSGAKQVVWCQEEPMNQGAWYSSQHHFRACMRQDQSLEFAGRPASSSPAVGLPSLHAQQQQQLVDDALTLNK